MIYRILADIMVIVHFCFILFVIGGGFLVLKWRKLIWAHIPVVIWGIFIEFSGWICPLTPWENHFRRLAGETVYQGDFIGKYILPLIYPEELTRNIQIILGSIVIAINLLVYAFIFIQSRRKNNFDWHLYVRCSGIPLWNFPVSSRPNLQTWVISKNINPWLLFFYIVYCYQI